MGGRVGGDEVLRGNSCLHFLGEVDEALEIGVGLVWRFDVSQSDGDFWMFGVFVLLEFVDLFVFAGDDLL